MAASFATRCAAILLAVSACNPTPPGFSSGDRWTFPLVDPLEDGLLITPVTINGHGPYLFAIDPDANVSAVDGQGGNDAPLRHGTGPERAAETATPQERSYAEVLALKVGNLTIDRRPAMVVPAGLYDTGDTGDAGGRHLSGVLGRDVLADAYVFG